MRKQIELVHDNRLLNETYTEHVAQVDGKKVTNIDTSALADKRIVVFNDENNKTLCEIYIPQTMLVKVKYIN